MVVCVLFHWLHPVLSSVQRRARPGGPVNRQINLLTPDFLVATASDDSCVDGLVHTHRSFSSAPGSGRRPAPRPSMRRSCQRRSNSPRWRGPRSGLAGRLGHTSRCRESPGLVLQPEVPAAALDGDVAGLEVARRTERALRPTVLGEGSACSATGIPVQ
jgi:hypothetical protein